MSWDCIPLYIFEGGQISSVIRPSYPSDDVVWRLIVEHRLSDQEEIGRRGGVVEAIIRQQFVGRRKHRSV